MSLVLKAGLGHSKHVPGQLSSYREGKAYFGTNKAFSGTNNAHLGINEEYKGTRKT